MSEYNSESSAASANQVADFVKRDDLPECELSICPGVGAAMEENLSDAGINKISQLLGHFLTRDNGARSCQEVCNAFFNYLLEIDIQTRYAHTITFCMANLAAEKGLFVYEQ
jgi:hypothetical protein